MRPMLVALCGSGLGSIGGITGSGGASGGIIIDPDAMGDLQWPLPGYTTLTTLFGEPDAIRGQPLRGVDIPAPAGTPI